jgi:hypothetical protein
MSSLGRQLIAQPSFSGNGPLRCPCLDFLIPAAEVCLIACCRWLLRYDQSCDPSNTSERSQSVMALEHGGRQPLNTGASVSCHTDGSETVRLDATPEQLFYLPSLEKCGNGAVTVIVSCVLVDPSEEKFREKGTTCFDQARSRPSRDETGVCILKLVQPCNYRKQTPSL